MREVKLRTIKEHFMLRLRPYKACDAQTIVSWIGDETAFRKWCADRFESYPITAEDLNRHYDAMADSDSFYEFTAFDISSPGSMPLIKSFLPCGLVSFNILFHSVLLSVS